MKEKNVSNLTKTLAVVSLLMPAGAQSLGIGDIELHSALNQKLNAEIRLHVAPGENPADISVRLAPPEKFDQAGVAWSYFLSKIKFEPVVQANGTVLVKMTSKEVLTEPFLDFLLEVSWPQGSQFREFTVLIDPPAEYNQSNRPIAVADTRNDRIEALEQLDKPQRASRASARRASRNNDNVSAITPQTASSGEYGPTQPSETLWNIADRLAVERNIPTKQMLSALFQANPEAFNRGNVDSLKTGVLLKIPETQAILDQSPAQARTQQKPVAKQVAAVAKPAVAANKALELVAPTEAKIADNAVVTGQGKAGQTNAAGSGNGSVASDAAASGDKDLELQSRIEKLEQQLGMMQQLLALKDQQLAALQSNNQPLPQNQPVPAVPSATPAGVEQAAPVQPAPVATVPAVQPPAVDIAQAPVPDKAAAAKLAPKPAPVVVEEDTGLFSSPSYLLSIGGLGAGILGVLGWLWWRNRKIDEMTNSESMFASASQIKMPDADSNLSVPVMEMNSTGNYDVGTVGESSFISDFTPSDFDAFDTDQNEVDPLSEADVYLAYGRYQQAEDLIRNAIKDQPDRDECKLKLLEIFYANENKDGFASYAQELADAGKQSDRSFWTKVADMAKDVIPDSVLFGGTAEMPSVASAASSSVSTESSSEDAIASFALADDDLIDLDSPTLPDLGLMDDVNSELAELELDRPEPSALQDNGLDFDLSAFSDHDNAKQTEVSSTVADIESIDFDLSDLSLGDALSKNVDAEISQAEDALSNFDLNFEVDAAEQAQPDVANPEHLDFSQPLDMESLEGFEFPDFDTIDNDEKPEILATTRPEAIDTVDEFDFNFDFDAPVSKGADSDEFDLSVADLTDMDEFETKIDLAKAYIDMGDTDAARAIAEEVLAKGSKEQQQAAQAILDELT